MTRRRAYGFALAGLVSVLAFSTDIDGQRATEVAPLPSFA